MKSIYKILIGLLLLTILIFGLYVYQYHTLAMVGWKLFNERCNNVNPLLIKTRNLHLALGAAMSGEASPSAENFKKDIESLPQYADQYLQLEKEWLDNQETYINRWDFQLLEPNYLKVAGRYQLAMYRGYYNYYEAISKFFNSAFKTKVTGVNTVSGDNTLELMDKYNNDISKNRELYDDTLNKGLTRKDWRRIFGQVPKLDCPETNLIIPNTYKPTSDQ